MRHKIAGKRLSRHQGARNALRRTLVKQLFEHERIKTTRAKAEAIRGQAEKLITIAKRGNSVADESPEKLVHARRMAAKKLNDSEIVKLLFDEIAPRYTERPGGYTRMMKLGPREGDRAEMVILELVE
jgi:large subunit ribosomal protein L17